ncbi:MerR family DNA-binding transcriptional regulator, partial [Streptomyces sp. NPDC000987]|uniref:MerR family DNA-binding transcriptional regulator n=1 Tax=Streptomyces sp. NPDC000987 TaxID=3154374 RepID=UPI0033238111
MTSASSRTVVRMRIGELAARAGTTTRTLRYYESRGGRGPPGGGHRVGPSQQRPSMGRGGDMVVW